MQTEPENQIHYIYSQSVRSQTGIMFLKTHQEAACVQVSHGRSYPSHYFYVAEFQHLLYYDTGHLMRYEGHSYRRRQHL